MVFCWEPFYLSARASKTISEKPRIPMSGQTRIARRKVTGNPTKDDMCVVQPGYKCRGASTRRSELAGFQNLGRALVFCVDLLLRSLKISVPWRSIGDLQFGCLNSLLLVAGFEEE